MAKQTYKALAALLLYPSIEQQQAADELLNVIKDEALLNDAQIAAIGQLTNHIASSDIYELQSAYINLFDRGRSYSLHLFEHIHGESRDRGQAMVDLAATYQEAGLEINSNELPDFLPLFLEYLSVADDEIVAEHLADAINIIGVIGARLDEAESPYGAIFSALIALSPKNPNAAEIKKAVAVKEEQSLEYLDDQWEEKPAFGDAADCNSCDIAVQTTFLTPEEVGARNE